MRKTTEVSESTASSPWLQPVLEYDSGFYLIHQCVPDVTFTLKAVNKLLGLKVRGIFSKKGYLVCKFYINQVVCSSLGGSSGSRGNMQQMARE
jgi:hypothetical protein